MSIDHATHPHHRGDVRYELPAPSYAELADQLKRWLADVLDSRKPGEIEALFRLSEAASLIQQFDIRGLALPEPENE